MPTIERQRTEKMQSYNYVELQLQPNSRTLSNRHANIQTHNTADCYISLSC